MVKIVKAGYEIWPFDGMALLKNIEKAGRTCYKSEGNITDTSCIDFAKKIIELGHESVLEHEKITVKFIIDRGVSHELVRHRISSFSQESTRYCNYAKEKFGNEITVINPKEHMDDITYIDWLESMMNAEASYLSMIARGCSAQIARSVLPNSLKTEIVTTFNIREWRHFFRLRTGPKAHPQMREVTIPLLDELKRMIPIVFDDI
jgi:thymidylate synthase (FAD)